MSYDLYLFRQKDQEISRERIFDFITSVIPVADTRNNTQWFYENKETGAYFSIDYSDESIDLGFTTDSVYTGFSFNINYFRPDFFGHEAFPLLDHIIGDLSLQVYNPQGEDVVRYFSKGELLSDWIEVNRTQSVDAFDKHELNYLDLEKSQYTWSFCFYREELQSALTEDIFVAGVFYQQPKGTRMATTLSVWPECIPVILPETDYIYVIQKKKGFLGTKEIKGLLEYKHLMDELGKYFQPYEYKGVKSLILSPEEREKAKAVFDSLNLERNFVDFGQGLKVEQIVNYRKSGT